MQVVHNANKLKVSKEDKIYQCSFCNGLFTWNNKARWYGSFHDLENHPEKIKYYCCKEHYLKDNQIKTK